MEGLTEEDLTEGDLMVEVSISKTSNAAFVVLV